MRRRAKVKKGVNRILDFDYCMKKFMQRCYAKNLSENTLTAYEVFFRSLVRYLKAIDKLDDIRNITPSDIRGYFIESGKTMNGITQVGYYRRLNTFFNFLVLENLISSSPMRKVDKPKAAKRIIQTFNSGEVKKMLAAFDVNTFLGRRNYTLLSLLLSTGLRRSEFIQLDITDVDLQNDIIRVIGKGDKERIIPISKMLAVLLRRYMRERELYLQRYLDTPAFFITKQGKRITKGCANSVFRELRISNNLTGKRFSAHTWRHTFAKAFLLNGGDIFTLQELLGHEDIETTKIYVNLTDTEKAQQNARYNPLDNKKWEYFN